MYEFNAGNIKSQLLVLCLIFHKIRYQYQALIHNLTGPKLIISQGLVQYLVTKFQ